MPDILTRLNERVADKLVTARPDGHGLIIFNYSERCVYTRAWDDVTMQARGLVLSDTGAVVARPFRKFFNVNETPETAIASLPAETPELSDKLDGSLVIVFWHPVLRRFTACTRGAWSNAQAQAANAWLAQCDWRMDKRFTYLFELVAPWNRIVVTYPTEKFVLIGRIDNETGEDTTYAELASIAEEIGLESVGFMTSPLSSVNMDAPTSNAEGYVARYPCGLRVKLKFADYRRLHKILTGLSVKGIWELLSTNGVDFIPDVPDEFIAWFDTHKQRFRDEFRLTEAYAQEAFANRPKSVERREIAEYFKAQEGLTPILFAMLDGKPYAPIIWKGLKPTGVGGDSTFQESCDD